MSSCLAQGGAKKVMLMCYSFSLRSRRQHVAQGEALAATLGKEP